MIEALSVSSEQDLQLLSQYLWSIKVVHRVSERAGQQVIWVESEEKVELVHDAYKIFLQGDLPCVEAIRSEKKSYLQLSLRSAPFVSFLIGVSFVLTALLQTKMNYAVFGFFRMGTPAYIIETGEFWRFITPVFLHASWLHLLANIVPIWFFGNQIERRESWKVFLLLMLLFSIIPNYAQYFASGTQFGGASGVLYATVSYCWLWNQLNKDKRYVCPTAIIFFSLAFLLIGFTKILSFFDLPPVGNAAHVSGFMCGLIAAWVMTNIKKRDTKHE